MEYVGQADQSAEELMNLIKYEITASGKTSNKLYCQINTGSW